MTRSWELGTFIGASNLNVKSECVICECRHNDTIYVGTLTRNFVTSIEDMHSQDVVIATPVSNFITPVKL
jgi:hypothetical protein